MAEATKTTTTLYHLDLTEEEAIWLRDITQNPISETFETPLGYKVRSDIFAAIDYATETETEE